MQQTGNIAAVSARGTQFEPRHIHAPIGKLRFHDNGNLEELETNKNADSVDEDVLIRLLEGKNDCEIK